jgi:hypothetical protein
MTQDTTISDGSCGWDNHHTNGQHGVTSPVGGSDAAQYGKPAPNLNRASEVEDVRFSPYHVHVCSRARN